MLSLARMEYSIHEAVCPEKNLHGTRGRVVLLCPPPPPKTKPISKKSFDANGNYSIGIKEQIIFPEINYDKIDKVRGMDVSIVTSTSNNNHALELLKGFNLPFRK